MNIYAKLAVAGYLLVTGYRFHMAVKNSGGMTLGQVAKGQFANEPFALATGGLIVGVILFGGAKGP